MNQAESAAWLADVTTDLPCGEDEEYSAEFRALEQAVAGKPDAQYGGTVIPATPPDWAEALSLASTLLAHSRDLRVAVHYTRAGLMREGFSGLARGLALIQGLLETRWDTVHPQLDASDQNDPTARVNAMSGLIDGAALPADLRDVPFVVPHGQHGITLRHVELATGELQQAGADVLSQEAIDAAFALAGVPQVEATLAALRGSLASVARIEALLTEHVGPARALDFAPLARVLARIAEVVAAHVPAESVQAEVATDDDASIAAATMGGAVTQHPAVAPRSAQIASVQDVIDALDKICTYYAQHEPSSPLPVLLQRARRLVGKSFIEIIEDVAPDGAGQFRHLGGVA